MLLLTVYWKADLALFRRPDLEKDKNKEQIWPGVVRLKLLFFGPKGEVKWVEKNRDGVSLPLSSWLRKLPFSFCHHLYYLDSLVGLSNPSAVRGLLFNAGLTVFSWITTETSQITTPFPDKIITAARMLNYKLSLSFLRDSTWAHVKLTTRWYVESRENTMTTSGAFYWSYSGIRKRKVLSVTNILHSDFWTTWNIFCFTHFL